MQWDANANANASVFTCAEDLFNLKQYIYQEYSAYPFVAIDARGYTEPLERW